jgi:Icc-related predicted phosphoesterase
MRIQILSDLHVDVATLKPIRVPADVDVVIVAGDTCEGVLKAFEHLRRIVPSDIPIVMVLGNHEPYRRFVMDELALARTHAPSFGICLVENDSAVIKGVRFVGCTLWTDYACFGERNVPAIMNACAKGMNDHRLIGWRKRPWLRFRPQEAALLHHRSRTFLAETLAVRFDGGPTVVTVHHAPHWNSVHPRFRSDPLTGAYVSDLEDLILATQPALIVHGHVHNSSDYRVGATRIICNPHGYGNENPNFDGTLIVEIGA